METKKKLILNEKTYAHLLRHFSKIDHVYRSNLRRQGLTDKEIESICSVPGSKFNAKILANLDDLLRIIAQGEVKSTFIQPNSNIAFSMVFNFPIGTEGIVSILELTEDERKSIKEINRNGFLLQAIALPQLKPTCELTYILSRENSLITAFPGRYAPPLPHQEMTFEEKKIATEFWSKHLFIELIN